MNKNMPSSFGSNQLTETLRATLVAYLEAQYHIRDEGLLDQRNRLFKRAGALWQDPYVESTKSYQSSSAYTDLSIPSSIASVLTKLADLGTGIPKTPYLHQGRALEIFFGENKDLIVSTGTGSGKTEAFLMPIIGQLVSESERSESRDLPGVRSLLLYPMNALVNDQLSRVRKIFGNEAANKAIRGDKNVPVRFGTYTSRTPYPGKRTASKDKKHIEPLFESFYLRYIDNEDARATFDSLGKWPSKNLREFYGAEKAEHKTYKSGKKQGQNYLSRNFNQRLVTQPTDRELLTRHEIHESPPDILITNYSMLEYMMLRPIEASIFRHTKTWLDANTENQFNLVIDEAHMYRGTGGAEVAYLVRRLCSRLQIPRDRMRVILTSASLGPEESSQETGEKFAKDLTGHNGRDLSVVLGATETRPKKRPAKAVEYEALDVFKLADFEQFHLNSDLAAITLTNFCHSVGWEAPEVGGLEGLQNYLFEQFQGFGPAEDLLGLVSGQAISLPLLKETLSTTSGCEVSDDAVASLISLCAFAKSSVDQKVFLPTRLHLLFRGVPGLFACINSSCSNKQSDVKSATKLGSLETVPKLSCECGGRVFELLTHRDCGKAFLRGFVDGFDGNFLWSEQTGSLFQSTPRPSVPIELLVDGEPHPQFVDYRQVWVDIKSGRLAYEKPVDDANYLACYTANAQTDQGVLFGQCPCCLKRWNDDRTKIMDLGTKGEAPFANLIKTLLTSQPAVKPETRDFPNGGRKVLLFSDGRQKAARLARDIPREVQSDTFRQAIAVASNRLKAVKKDARPNVDLYVAFLSVVSDYNLSMFDGDDASLLKQHVFQYEDCEDLEEALEEQPTPVGQYKRSLLEQLCGRFYSLPGTTIGYLGFSRTARRRFSKAFEDNISDAQMDLLESVALSWISLFAESYSFDQSIDSFVRMQAARFPRQSWGKSNKLPKELSRLSSELGISQQLLGKFEKSFESIFLISDPNGEYFLNPDRLSVEISLESEVYQCQLCLNLSFFCLGDRCTNCGSSEVLKLDVKTDPYIKARKGFWRDPVQQAIDLKTQIRSMDAQEHSAQLSHRDSGEAYSTTEDYELRFQDVVLGDDKPIDILSSTTTMEVGVDIGSLVAVGLRNVPPQRENYQQRAGRAGRRGSSISAVLTYAQNGPHDAYYFSHPETMVAGPSRSPEIKIGNPKIARRHIHSHLLQSFFHGMLVELPDIGQTSGRLESSLGMSADFYSLDEYPNYNFVTFKKVLENELKTNVNSLISEVIDWLPDELIVQLAEPDQWVRKVVTDFLEEMDRLKVEGLSLDSGSAEEDGGSEDDDGSNDEPLRYTKSELLDFMFFHGLLPSYAFPTDVASFLIEKIKERKVLVEERPQQAIAAALSEYAPGRIVVVNKKSYRVGGITADCLPTTYDRATGLFAKSMYVRHCGRCNHVEEVTNQDYESRDQMELECPVCGDNLFTESVLKPEVFHPEDGRQLRESDTDQEITYATYAQFPIPEDATNQFQFALAGKKVSATYGEDCKLITLNRGALVNEEATGFNVCKKCGRSSTKPQSGSHTRPYFPEYNFKERYSKQCDGEFENVYLGHDFSTDLLLLRFDIDDPVASDISDIGNLRIIEDALYSVSEALKIAASTHPQLDLDDSEFGVGFRVVPKTETSNLAFDVYLYDTLSGGGGYSEMAFKNIQEILQNTSELLSDCKNNCESSCQHCLRHYRNQHIQERLDRHLGYDLLNYALGGELNADLEKTRQKAGTQALARLLEIDGAECLGEQNIDGVWLPQVFSHEGQQVAIGVFPGLLNEESSPPAYKALDDNLDYQLISINEYFLKRNLPEQHLKIRKALSM